MPELYIADTKPESMERFLNRLYRFWTTARMVGKGLPDEWLHEKLVNMGNEEYTWKNAYCESLVKEGLLGSPETLRFVEAAKIIYMDEDEKETWRSQLKGIKADRESQQETNIQPESWPERLKSSAHYFEKKVSLQVPMHPQMREQVAALATAHGLGSGEFVEKMLAEQLAQDSKRVVEGRKLIAQNQFKRPYRAKVQALRKEIEELRRENSHQRG